MTDIALPQIGRTRRVAFYVLVGLFSLLLIAVLFFLSPVQYPRWVIVGWFSPRPPDVHQLHNMMGGAANWVFMAAIMLQLHKPERKVAGLQMVILWLLGQIIGSLITGAFGLFLLIPLLFLGGIALLHPGRQELLRIGRPINLELLALVGLAAVPLLIYVFNQMNLQLTPTDQHAEWFHYGSLADQVLFAILLAGLLASFKTPGWRIPAWSAGFMAAVLGLASVLFPAQASSVGVMWGSLAVVWGLAFIGVAEWKQRQESEV